MGTDHLHIKVRVGGGDVTTVMIMERRHLPRILTVGRCPFYQRCCRYWGRHRSAVRVVQIGVARLDPLAVAAILQRRHREYIR